MPDKSSVTAVGTPRLEARRLGILLAGLACFLGAVAIAVTSLTLLAESIFGDEPARTAGPVDDPGVVPAAPASAVLNDDWLERITRDTSWRGGRSPSQAGSAPRRKGANRLQGPPVEPAANTNSWFFVAPGQGTSWWDADSPPAANNPAPKATGPSRNSGAYRTVCVRLCDGSFFPVGFGTSESRFSRDQTTCSNTCPGSRLFYYRPSTQDSEEMVDVDGKPYSQLPNANLFRTQYVPSCKCKPHPWEQASVDKHRLYALEDERRRGNKAVVAELEQLKAQYRLAAKSASKLRQYSSRTRGRAAPSNVVAAAPVQTPEQTTAPRSDASRGQGGGVLSSATVAAASAATVQSIASGQPAPAATRQAPAPREPSIAPVRSLSVSGQALPGRSELPPKSPIAGLPLTIEPQPSTGAPLSTLPFTAPPPAVAPLPLDRAQPAVITVPPAATPRKTRSSRKADRNRTRTAAPRQVRSPGRTAEWTRGVYAPF